MTLSSLELRKKKNLWRSLKYINLFEFKLNSKMVLGYSNGILLSFATSHLMKYLFISIKSLTPWSKNIYIYEKTVYTYLVFFFLSYSSPKLFLKVFQNIWIPLSKQKKIWFITFSTSSYCQSVYYWYVTNVFIWLTDTLSPKKNIKI